VATCAITGGATVAAPATATISSTLTGNWTTAARMGLAAGCVAGLASSSPFDVAGNGYSTSAGVVNLTAGTLSVTPSQTNSIVLAVWGAIGGTYSAWNENTNFTSATPATIGNNTSVRIAYCITNCTAASAVTYQNASWTTSRIIGAQEWVFKPASGAAVVCTRSLLGVGC
jgi:hypothetical protein